MPSSHFARTWIECCCCDRVADRIQHSNATSAECGKTNCVQNKFLSSIEVVCVVHRFTISKSMDLIILCLLAIWTLIYPYRTLITHRVFIYTYFELECSSRESVQWYVWRLIQPISRNPRTAIKGCYSHRWGVSGLSHEHKFQHSIQCNVLIRHTLPHRKFSEWSWFGQWSLSVLVCLFPVAMHCHAIIFKRFRFACGGFNCISENSIWQRSIGQS